MLTSLRGKLILIFVVLTVSVVIISSVYARYKQRQFALDRAKERAVVDLQLISSNFSSILRWTQRDLLVLRDLPSLHEALNTDNPELRQAAFRSVAEEFLSLALHHQIFQQIRFIDNSGRERIQVNTSNRQPRLTPDEKLQDKSSRDFFKATLPLSPGQIYTSPMNLDLVQGKSEHQPMPVVRYATPVTDDRGTTRGILVLNVFGTTFLSILQEQQEQARHGERYYLLNKDGYFLYHPDNSKTFGFMLKGDETFNRYEPQLASWLQSGDHGITVQKSHETSKQTLFAFQRISPVSQNDATGIATKEKNTPSANSWILLTAVDDADLLVGFDEYIQSVIPFTLLLLAICIVVAVLVAWSCSRPVVSLATAAKKIQGGDFSARAKVYTSDDMGKFGDQFNAMATRLEQTINRLQLSETKYRQIFENSRDCIFVTDTRCNIVDINRAGRRLLGVDDDSPLDQLSLNCCRTGSPDNKNAKPVIQQDMHSKGYVKDYETTLQRPDGTVRYCVMTASARYDEQGSLQGYEGILRDVTAEKQRQEASRSFQKQLQEEIVLAEERERRHIGQILHEEMAQNLALVNMKLREAEQQIGTVDLPQKSTADVGRQLIEIQGLITLMIRQIRTMIFDLFPTMLDDQGLVPTMIWYGDHFTSQTNINVSVYGVSGSLGLAESQKIYLFRSFKELLHNAWKHAGAQEIVATVKKKDNHVRLTVDDDGQGFDPNEIKSGDRVLRGIGLISIRQWVAAMEGTMSIESEAGKGARIAIDIPITTEGDS